MATISRRRALQVAAATLAYLSRSPALLAREAPGRARRLAVIDPRFEASQVFAQHCARFGVEPYVLCGDLGALWLHIRADCMQRRPLSLLGFTSEPTLFCLDLMTRSHGLRIVHRSEHGTATPEAQLRSIANDAQERLTQSSVPLRLELGPTLRPHRRLEPLWAWAIGTIQSGAREPRSS